MPNASLLIRRDIASRTAAFRSGLERCGFTVSDFGPPPQRADVLVIWNRHRHAGPAKRYEAVGARVIIAENGYLTPPGGNKTIALALGHHNGAGCWPDREEDRWPMLGIELRPWRMDGEHIMVLAQRGIGETGVAEPRGWSAAITAELAGKTKRRVVIRPHPGIHWPEPQIDWSKCWAAVTWGSSAGIKAIVAGIPVFHGFDSWIGAAAARFGFEDLEAPFLGDRAPMLRRLAAAQWSLDEIATGEPFARLLGR